MNRIVRRTLCTLFWILLINCPANAGDFKSFVLKSHYAVPEGRTAENICATPDGNFLYYTDTAVHSIGITDITNPGSPRHIGFISTDEAMPTSVAVSPDGKFLVFVARNGDDQEKPFPGTLFLYDIQNPREPVFRGSIPVGVGPSSVALTEVNNNLVAIVAIKDGEFDEHGRPALSGKRPGSVDVLILDTESPASSSLATVTFPKNMLKTVYGINFSSDPKPEFVTVHPREPEVAVSLQSNNAIAHLDISNPARPVVKDVFCAGTTPKRNTDLKQDKKIAFTDEFRGRREPKMITYVTKGKNVYLALANEGDTDEYTFSDGIYSGGRNMSLHSPEGVCIWETDLDLERHVALFGHYPDRRSEKRGIEIEGITSANFFGDDLLIGASEHGSFLAVYRLNDFVQGEFIQILPTGSSPEGVITIHRADGNNLLVCGNKYEGSINIYAASRKNDLGTPDQPLVFSRKFTWASLSGLTTDGKNLYAVGDHCISPSRIWRLNMSKVKKGQVEIDQEIVLTKNKKAVHYDFEDICWTKNGFWLVAEGKKAEENLLIFAQHDGTIVREHHLSPNLIRSFGAPIRYGFEGIAVSPDEKTVYIAMQRGFNPGKAQSAIIRFHVETQKWSAAWYPLTTHSKNPKKYWTSISALSLTGDGRILVLERDKAEANMSEVKRIYAVQEKDFAHKKIMPKELVCDILSEHGILQRRIEGLCLLNGEMWIVNDNNGAGWTQLVNLGRLKK